MKKTALALGLVILALPALAHDYASGGISIAHPWARPIRAGAAGGGAFMTLTNTGAAPDRLVAVSSPAAEKAEIHEMIMDGDVMTMRPAEAGVALPPGQPVALKPGGIHVMLMGPKAAHAPGERFPLTLTFEKAPPVTVEIQVETMGYAPEPTAGTPAGHAHH